jgi:hypothetical protein
MKATSIILIALFTLACLPTLRAQQPATQPANTSQTDKSVNTVPNQLPTGQGTVSGTSQPADPSGTGQQPSTAQPGNDYHLTQPSTSPVGAQIGTQNTNQSATTPQPYNQQPGEVLRVERSQLPGRMIDTLNDPMYEGWENSTIYYNRGTNEYSFDVGTGAEVKNYRFDRDGNPVQQKSGNVPER